MKKILGITGGIGAGKSYVAKLFAELGATVVDADKIAREILEPDGRAYLQVVETFGREVLTSDGFIDRKKLAGIVFADNGKLEVLNGLTHPVVFEEMKKQIDSAETELVCLDVPLLFSCDFPIPYDMTLAVIAPTELRITRILDRDCCTREDAIARMENQLSDAELQEKADFSLVNAGDQEALEQEVEKIYQHILER